MSGINGPCGCKFGKQHHIDCHNYFDVNEGFEAMLNDASELLAMKEPADWTTAERAFARAAQAFDPEPIRSTSTERES